jgi:hypothetical protein
MFAYIYKLEYYNDNNDDMPLSVLVYYHATETKTILDYRYKNKLRIRILFFLTVSYFLEWSK